MSAATSTPAGSKTEPPITVRRLASGTGLTRARIVRAVRQALGDRPVEALNIALIDDRQMSRLHLEYMGDDSPTDVLTFDLRDDPDALAIEGEIVVSVDTARREAHRRGLDPAEELTRYVIHGVLHLRGMDDQNPRDRMRMRREENRVLGLLAGPPVPRQGLERRSRAPAARSAARTGKARKKR